MKNWVRYLLFGLVVLLLFVVATVPAEWVAAQAEKRVDDLVVFGAQGTLWSGQAEAVAFDAQVLRNPQWQVAPWSLLLGRVKVSFHGRLDDGQVGGVLIRSLFGSGQPLSLRDFYLQQPAAQLAGLFVPAESLPEVHGKLDISFNDLQMQANGILSRADGTLLWSEAAVEQNREKIVLGDFSLQLITVQDQIEMSLRDAGGPLKTELNATQQIATGDLAINGTLGYREGANRLIVMLMSAQLNLRGDKEKPISLQGNIKSLAGLWEQVGQ